MEPEISCSSPLPKENYSEKSILDTTYIDPKKKMDLEGIPFSAELPREKSVLARTEGVRLDMALIMADDTSQWTKRSIYRVPTRINNLKRQAYVPQMVSLGPYHHLARHLTEMEKHKIRARDRFVRRSGKTEGYYINALRPKVKDLLSAYGPSEIEEWQGNPDGFLNLLIKDGCFILEILRCSRLSEDLNGYDSRDPVFSQFGLVNISPYLVRDMLMLENQLPILLLDILHEQSVESGQQMPPADQPVTLLLSFFGKSSSASNVKSGLHILDVYRKGILQEINLYFVKLSLA